MIHFRERGLDTSFKDQQILKYYLKKNNYNISFSNGGQQA